jgi:hypothetical protein
MHDAMKGCLTAGQAAQLAGITRERLLRRVQVGDVDGQFIGGRWVIDKRSLGEFIAREDSHGRLPAPSNAR